MIYYLVGCKLDLNTARVVSQEEAEDFAMEFTMPYVEISSKNNHGVEELFSELVGWVLHYLGYTYAF